MWSRRTSAASTWACSRRSAAWAAWWARLYAGWAFDYLGHGVPFYTGAAIVLMTITIGTGLDAFIPARKT